MNEIIIVDADGNRIRSNFDKKKPKSKPKWRNLKMFHHNHPLPKSPTPADLGKLEDCIHHHGKPFITEYLNIYKNLESTPDKDLDKYLTNHEPRKMKALRHCWLVLNWRPSQSGNRILKKNPYTDTYKVKVQDPYKK